MSQIHKIFISREPEVHPGDFALRIPTIQKWNKLISGAFIVANVKSSILQAGVVTLGCSMTASSMALREGAMSSTMVVGIPVRKPACTVATTAWSYRKLHMKQTEERIGR